MHCQFLPFGVDPPRQRPYLGLPLQLCERGGLAEGSCGHMPGIDRTEPGAAQCPRALRCLYR